MNTQKRRIFNALMNGETVSRLWAANQFPIVAQPGNRCNEMIASGLPINKDMIHPEEGAKYMAFWMDKNSIQHVMKNKDAFKYYFD